MENSKEKIFYKVLKQKIEKHFQKNPKSKKLIIKAKLKNEDIFWEAVKVGDKKYHINEVRSLKNNFNFLLESDPEKTSKLGKPINPEPLTTTGNTNVGKKKIKKRTVITPDSRMMADWNPFSPLPDTKFNRILKRTNGDIESALKKIPPKVFRNVAGEYGVNSFQSLKNNPKDYNSFIQRIADSNPTVAQLSNIKPTPGSQVSPDVVQSRDFAGSEDPTIVSKNRSNANPVQNKIRRLDTDTETMFKWNPFSPLPDTEFNKTLKQTGGDIEKALDKVPPRVFRNVMSSYNVNSFQELSRQPSLFQKVIEDLTKSNPNISKLAGNKPHVTNIMRSK